MKAIQVLGATVGAGLGVASLYIMSSREAWAVRLVENMAGAILICLLMALVGFALFMTGWLGWELSGEAVWWLTGWRKGRSR